MGTKTGLRNDCLFSTTLQERDCGKHCKDFRDGCTDMKQETYGNFLPENQAFHEQWHKYKLVNKWRDGLDSKPKHHKPTELSLLYSDK